MREMYEMFDFDEMRYIDPELDSIRAIDKIRDLDMAIMEEALVKFVDDIVLEERSIA